MRRIGLTHQVLKASFAAGLAWTLAVRFSPNPYPYFAPLAVILTFQATIADTMAKALYRVAGIIGGVIVAMLIGYWLRPGAIAVALATLLGMTVSTTLRLNPAIISQVGVTALLVLVAQDSPHYAMYRILETALGAVVAIVVNAAIVPPNEIPLAERRITELTNLLARRLAALSPVREPDGSLVRHLAKEVDQGIGNARLALRAAEASGKFNPFLQERGERLLQLSRALGELERVAIQVRGIARGLNDLEAGDERFSLDLQVALQDTAHCIAVFGETIVSPADEAAHLSAVAVDQAETSQSRCLSHLRATASLTLLRDMGAILADLNRILSEVRVHSAGPKT